MSFNPSCPFSCCYHLTPSFTLSINSLSLHSDNIHTDIFGMNLYREYVRRHRGSKKRVAMQGARGFDISMHDFKGLMAEQCYSVLVRVSQAGFIHTALNSWSCLSCGIYPCEIIIHLHIVTRIFAFPFVIIVCHCTVYLTVLSSVQTGVYNEDSNGEAKILEHCPRDFLPVEAKLQEPSLTVKCVLEAIHTIYRQENFS